MSLLRVGLIRTYVLGLNFGQDEVLCLDRISGQPSQHGQLSCVGHSIGQWPLEKLFVGDTLEWNG